MQCPRVAQFLIAAEISCLCLIECALKSCVGSNLIDTASVSRHLAAQCSTSEGGISLGKLLGFLSGHHEVFVFVKVSHLCHTVELYIRIIDANGLCGFRRVVQGDGTGVTFKGLNILYKDIGTVCLVVFSHISLQHQRVLVEGNEFLVAEQIHGLWSQCAHVATDEQW